MITSIQLQCHVQEAGLGGRLAPAAVAAAAADGRAPRGHPAEVLAHDDVTALLADHAAGGDLRVHLRHALEAHEQGRDFGGVSIIQGVLGIH